MIEIKRIYDPPGKDDGTRILVDRLWPRGMSKEKAALDLWMKEVAPSDVLRRWYAHDPAKWNEFRQRYRKELQREDAAALVAQLKGMARKVKVTLLYSAREYERNNAVALRELLEE